MSLWAAVNYHFTFTSLSLKVPASLTFWHHAYTLNTLLTIQETADTFGLLCLGLLFVYAQLLSRNSMLAIFTLFESSVKDSSNSPVNVITRPNKVKILVRTSTTLRPLIKFFTSPLHRFRGYFLLKTSRYKF